MSVNGAKREAKLILKDVAKGLTTIVVPPKKDEQPSEFLTLHWCNQCQAYHRSKR
jgi:hypothetical protein